jgi:hypothetical protein
VVFSAAWFVGGPQIDHNVVRNAVVGGPRKRTSRFRVIRYVASILVLVVSARVLHLEERQDVLGAVGGPTAEIAALAAEYLDCSRAATSPRPARRSCDRRPHAAMAGYRIGVRTHLSGRAVGR